MMRLMKMSHPIKVPRKKREDIDMTIVKDAEQFAEKVMQAPGLAKNTVKCRESTGFLSDKLQVNKYAIHAYTHGAVTGSGPSVVEPLSVTVV